MKPKTLRMSLEGCYFLKNGLFATCASETKTLPNL